MKCWSKWLNYWLENLKPFIPMHKYIKDGDQALEDLKPLVLPPNALLFMTDAHYMYNNRHNACNQRNCMVAQQLYSCQIVQLVRPSGSINYCAGSKPAVG